MDRILVVDDEKSIVFALRRYFVQQGYIVDTALTDHVDASITSMIIRRGRPHTKADDPAARSDAEG